MKRLMNNSLGKDKVRWKFRWINRNKFAGMSSYEKYRRHILSVRNEVYRQKIEGTKHEKSSYDVDKWDFSNEPKIPGRIGWKNEHWKIYKDAKQESMRRITNRPIGRYTPWGNLRQIYPDFESAADWVLWYFQEHISDIQGARTPTSKERIARRIRQCCLHWLDVPEDDQFAWDYFWEDEIYNMGKIPSNACPYDYVWKYLTFEEAITIGYGDLESLEFKGSRGSGAKTKLQN